MAVVLCTGSDRVLMETRRMILERSGHHVVTAMTIAEIEDACCTNVFDVAVVGQAMSAQEKRRIADVVRQHCPTAKILELHRCMTAPILNGADAWLEVPADVPSELAERVSLLGKQKPGKSKSRSGN